MNRAAAGRSRFASYAWGVLGFNLLVILWGAFVRASGSGAGCGSHWPLCNGEVVPRAPAMATVIELTHRLTSGVALLLVVGLVFGARRARPPGHPARMAAWLSLLFIAVEALLGAGLVLLEYVADDTRVARGFWVAGHLANTFVLVAVLALAAWWADCDGVRRVRPSGSSAAALVAAIAGMLVLGMSGAITALGDTLFPAASWLEGKAQTFSESAHVFVRLRVWHPSLALAVGAALVAAVAATWRTSGLEAPTRRTSGLEATTRPSPVRVLGTCLLALYALELLIGLANMRLLAPIELQMVHLLLADACWIALVLLTAEVTYPRDLDLRTSVLGSRSGPTPEALARVWGAGTGPHRRGSRDTAPCP